MANLVLTASALLLSMIPQMTLAKAASITQLNDHFNNPVPSVLPIARTDCVGPVADMGSAGVDSLKNEKVAAQNVSPPMYIAEEAAKSPPEGLDARGRRRRETRKPVDPVPSAECLATGKCAKPAQPRKGIPRSDNSNPIPKWPTNSSAGMEPASFVDGAQSISAPVASTCAASAGLKNISPALRKRLLALAGSQEADECARAVAKLLPFREQLRDAYENALPEDLSKQFIDAATDYIAKCLGNNLLLDQGALTPAEETFLRAHTGLIVQRAANAPQVAQPICQAARLGKLVITAQHCVPINPSSVRGSHSPEIAFRFLDRPTIYDLVPRLLHHATERATDYAIFEIVGAPGLWEKIEPLVGKVALFADFYDLTANIYLRLVNNRNSETALDFRRASLFEHSTLCRPAYIGANGLFLHACQTEAGLSGTPFFQRQHGHLVFVGIHNGVTEALEDPSLAACAHGLPNYGVSVPPSALIGIQTR